MADLDYFPGLQCAGLNNYIPTELEPMDINDNDSAFLDEIDFSFLPPLELPPQQQAEDPHNASSLYQIKESNTPYFMNNPLYQDSQYQPHPIIAPISQPVWSHVTFSNPQEVVDLVQNMVAFSAPTKKKELIKEEDNSTTSTHRRRHGYTALTSAPRSWGCFSYNRFGELEPGRTYSVQQIYELLYQNSGCLTLWIQRTPEDHAIRCGDPLATQCRFENCHYNNNNNIISVGEPRVAIDELTMTSLTHDPQHNSGFVHLSCLEKYMDFPRIIRELTVKAENRTLPLEGSRKNSMILKNITELHHVERFLKFCKDTGRPPRSYAVTKLFQEMLPYEGLKASGPSQADWQRRGKVAAVEEKERQLRQKAVVRHRREQARAAKQAEPTRKYSKKRAHNPEESEEEEQADRRKTRKVRAGRTPVKAARAPRTTKTRAYGKLIEPESESSDESEEERPSRRRRSR